MVPPPGAQIRSQPVAEATRTYGYARSPWANAGITPPPCSPTRARVSGPGGGDPTRLQGAQIRSQPVADATRTYGYAQVPEDNTGITPPPRSPIKARVWGSGKGGDPRRFLPLSEQVQGQPAADAARKYGQGTPGTPGQANLFTARNEAPRSLQGLYSSPAKARGRATAQQNGKSPVARALAFAPTAAASGSRRHANHKRKAETIGSIGLGDACDASTASLVTLQPDPLRAAQAQGKRLRTTCFIIDRLVAATNRLAKSIPEDWLIDMMEEKKEDYLLLEPEAVLRWLHNEAMEGFWNTAEIIAFIAAIGYISRWLSERDLTEGEIDLGQVPIWRITECLREYRNEKRIAFATRNAARAAAQAGEEQSEAPETANHTGASSGQYFLRGLKFGRKFLKSPIKSENIKLSNCLDGGQKQPPRPATSTSLFIIMALEALLKKGGVGVVQRHLAAAYLFLCYACMRCKQSTDCWITGIMGDEFVEGFVACEKNPKRGKRLPRPWWAPLYGATNSRLWLDTLLETLKDVKDDCYIFRGFFSPDGSVLNASSLAPGPLQCGAQLAGAMQQILQLACGWTVGQSVGYSEHSPRHFLNEVARARGEPAACRQEIGRWSFSVAQMACMRPISGAVRAHMAALRAMPDRYSQEAEKMRPMTILRRQMDAVRKLVAQMGSDIPEHEGWHLLEHFVVVGGEHEQ